MKNKMDSNKFKNTMKAIDAYSSLTFDKTDSLGSYSGLPTDCEQPIQDVDDL